VRTTEIRPGLWRWTAPHPDWNDGEEWPQEVGCVYFEAPDATVLVDPLVPVGEEARFFSALDGDVERRGLPVSILLTVEWHARSRDALAARYENGPERPQGVEPFTAPEVDETLWWIPEHAALVTGDVLLGLSGGIRVCPDSWLDGRSSPAGIRQTLKPLLGLPVERILPAHGEPVLAGGHAALAAALRE
jgi:hypothetical protein